MKRGRPVQSEIRQNMIEILFFVHEAYGYQIYKIYKNIFPAVTLRSMYYHLKKGVETGEFKKVGIRKDEGEYSWGPSTERIVYGLGDQAKPTGDARVEEYVRENNI